MPTERSGIELIWSGVGIWLLAYILKSCVPIRNVARGQDQVRIVHAVNNVYHAQVMRFELQRIYKTWICRYVPPNGWGTDAPCTLAIWSRTLNCAKSFSWVSFSPLPSRVTRQMG